MNRLICIISVLLFSAGALTAQTNEKEEVFTIVEEMPVFSLDDPDALAKYLGTIIYPNAAKEKDIQGKVFIRFIVDKDGSIISPEIMKSSGNDLLDSAALKHIQQMPNWDKPGRQRSKPVKVQYIIPINFKLDDGTKLTPQQERMNRTD